MNESVDENLNKFASRNFKVFVVVSSAVGLVMLILALLLSSAQYSPTPKSIEVREDTLPVSYSPVSYPSSTEVEQWTGKITLKPEKASNLEFGETDLSNCTGILPGIHVYADRELETSMVINNKNLANNTEHQRSFTKTIQMIKDKSVVMSGIDQGFPYPCGGHGPQPIADVSVVYGGTDYVRGGLSLGSRQFAVTSIDYMPGQVSVYAIVGDNIIKLSTQIWGDQLFTVEEAKKCERKSSDEYDYVTFDYECLADIYNQSPEDQELTSIIANNLAEYYRLQIP
jgi:hypothetical protein